MNNSSTYSQFVPKSPSIVSAVISGGGANVVLVFYNGSNWTVIGK